METRAKISQITKILRSWLSRVNTDFPEIYLVGGSVRDYFLARRINDIDLACPDPEQAAFQIAKNKDARIVSFKKKADQPCYRIIDRTNRLLSLDISQIQGESIYFDLKRRDFTMNAMAFKIGPGGKTEELIDPLNGFSDIKKRIIRVTGKKAFPSDPVRILRGFRFAAELNFTMDKKTLAEIKIHAQALTSSPAERIMYELIKIFSLDNSSNFVKTMDNTVSLGKIFPEIKKMKKCPQNGYHHQDVWSHSINVLEKCENIIKKRTEFFGHHADKVFENLLSNSRLPLIKIGALLHDVGKPETRGFSKKSDRITFYGHDKTGEKTVGAITSRLRMSNRDSFFLQMLAGEHMRPAIIINDKTSEKTRVRWFKKVKEDVVPLVILAMADVMSKQGPLSVESGKKKLLKILAGLICEYYEKRKNMIEQKNLISGKDIIPLGINPGPAMGTILKKIREAQELGLLETKDEALAMAKKLNMYN